MNKRLFLGILLAVVASAVTVAVVVVGQENDQPLIGPSKALRPSEITKLPLGTPIAGLAEPLDYGPFRILPAGSKPPPPCGPPVPPGRTQERVVITESPTQADLAGYDEKAQRPPPYPKLDQFRAHALYFEPPYMPAGWQLSEVHAETIFWDDGSQTDSIFYLTFSQPDYFDISIGRGGVDPNCRVEYVEYLPEGGHAYTLGQIRGVPILYQHQKPGEAIQADLWVEFVAGRVLTRVHSIAIDFDELLKIADALIAQYQQTAPSME